MSYRILVDENTSPRVAELLRGKEHEAVHVTKELEAGISDQDIVNYATNEGYVVLTCDDDFLLPEYAQSAQILYYSDETLSAYEIADRVDQVSRYVPDATDLPGITNLGSWD
jgi:predicted nuclease of predicted toxin-antitoxin system